MFNLSYYGSRPPFYEIDEELRYKVQRTYAQCPFISGVRKMASREIELIEMLDTELYTFTFVHIKGDYGIVSEDEQTNMFIQIDFSDGRVWRVPRQMVEYDNNPPLNVQKDFKVILPKITSSELITNPSIEELRMMTPSKLSAVEDFEIVHEPTGSRVFFKGKTDLRGVDIDEAVRFSQSVVEFYPETTLLPSFNTKLNREAYVELHGCFPDENTPLNVYCRCLKRLCESNGARFISYKEEKGTWAFVFNGMK